MNYPAAFIVTKGQVFWSRHSDDLEYIIREFRLEDVVRVMISPPRNDLSAPLEIWGYYKVQREVPSWYDSLDAEKRVREVLPQWYETKVIGPGQVRTAHDVGNVYVWGGVLRDLWHSGKVEWVAGGGKVENVYGGVIECVCEGIVDCVQDGGIIREVFHRGRVKALYDGTIEEIRDGGVVDRVWTETDGHAVVNNVHGGVVYDVSGGVVLSVAKSPISDVTGVVGRVRNGGVVITYIPLPGCRISNDSVLIDRRDKDD